MQRLAGGYGVFDGEPGPRPTRPPQLRGGIGGHKQQQQGGEATEATAGGVGLSRREKEVVSDRGGLQSEVSDVPSGQLSL